MKKVSILLCCAMILVLLLTACSTHSPEITEPTESTAPMTTEPQPVTVQTLQVVSLPDKTQYLLGEDFDANGLVINAIMSDGSVVENVDWSLPDDLFLTTNTTGVKVSYEGKSAMIPVVVRHPGNVDIYSVANFETMEDSPLKDKAFLWLGSSVTLGSASLNESMADFIAKKHDCTCIKKAVSGTTLATYKDKSYVERLNAYIDSPDRAEYLDAVIVQLSTNDQYQPDKFGVVTADDVRDPSVFDTETTFGAMEYIVATAKQTWDCPVLFYANPPTELSSYMDMVLGLYEIAAKWDVVVIDMYMDLEFNNMPTEEQRELWMSDKIHPTKAGYRDWWLPKFEDALISLE